MVKQSRVTGSVSSSLAPGAAALKDDPKRIEGSAWKTAARVSSVFAVGLLAAFSAPREAKAIGFFVLDSGTAMPSPQPCQDTKSGCFTSWLTTADIDGDGDMDVLMANGGGYYSVGAAEESVVYLNNKGVLTNVTPTAFNNAHNRNRQIAVADVDMDGDLDIYQPGAFGFDLDKLFIQTTPGVYEDKSATLLPDGLMSHAGSCHMGDLDGDADPDLIVMDWGMGSTNTVAHAILYTNDGKGKFTLAEVEKDPGFWAPTNRLPPTIAAAGVNPPQPATASLTAGTLTYWGVRPIDVDFADVDNDFDLDIVINMRNGFSRIFLNDGNANFTDATNFQVAWTADGLKQTVTTNYPSKQGPYVYNQEVCDIDDDGDLDLLIDNVGTKPATNISWAYGGGTGGNVSQILVNDGHGKFTDDTVNRVFGEPGADDNALKCADLNNDNHYDLIVASLTSGRSEKLLMNDGTGRFIFAADGIPYGFSGTSTTGDSTLGHDLTDLNGDKMLDMITGQGEGGFYEDKVYFGAGGSVPDTKGPLVRAVQTPAPLSETPTVIRYALRDNVTNEQGQEIKATSVTYNIAGGASKTVTGKFYGGDLFRATIPAQVAGTVVTFKVNATDRASNTSTSPALTYTVPTPVPPPVVIGVGGSGGGDGGGSGGATAGAGGASAGSGGAMAGSGGASGGSAGELGEAGEAGETSVGGRSSTGGSSSGTAGKPSTGKAGSSSVGGSTGEAGESSAGTAGKGHYETVDDGGCSVSSSTPASKSRGAALLGLGLAMLGLFRRRNSKQ